MFYLEETEQDYFHIFMSLPTAKELVNSNQSILCIFTSIFLLGVNITASFPPPPKIYHCLGQSPSMANQIHSTVWGSNMPLPSLLL